MIEERPYLQIPLPNPNDYRLYEEWLKKQSEEKEANDEQSDGVIIIDL